MLREQLEKNQIVIYAVALAVGAGIGLLWPHFGPRTEILITPVLAVLLYGMFSQIPFFHLREAFSNRRFLAALLTVNFFLVPILVWLLVQLLPEQPPLLLGVYLVLLTPCIDYVVVFTHLGDGNARLMLASTPLLLLAQMTLLPAYLWIFMGSSAVEVMSARPFLEAFLGLIVLPLALALGTEFWAKRRRSGEVWLNGTAWLPVPFMALTLLVVVASQIGKVESHFPLVIRAIPIYIAFMILAPILARLTACAFRLETEAGRTLVFSAGTRNSLVVLPLALALPDTWILASVVIVTQTLVELIGELFYIRLVPSVIIPETRRGGATAGFSPKGLLGCVDRGKMKTESEVPGLMERVGESVRGRRAAAKLDPVEDEIRKFILRKFAVTGKAPSLQEIGEEMGLASMESVSRTLEKLEGADILTRKEENIVSAYPFSALETRHRVVFADGSRVYALCATDALGISFMLNESITILSRCPWCEGEMEVTVKNGRIDSRKPEGMLEFVSERERCGCTAETCCPYINFFCSRVHLSRWREKNSELANGETYTLDEALEHGRVIFGDFLDK